MNLPNESPDQPTEPDASIRAWADLIAGIVIQRMLEEPGYAEYLQKQLAKSANKIGTLRHIPEPNHDSHSRRRIKPIDPCPPVD